MYTLLYWLAAGLVLTGLTSCDAIRSMDNPIYKYSPAEVFSGPALEVAWAVRHNDPDQIDRLCQARKAGDLEAAGQKGMTLLFWAYAHRSEGCLRALVRCGAKVNAPLRLLSANTGRYYTTHLINIAVEGPSESVLETLLALGANPSLRDQQSYPTLHNAVFADRYDRVHFLVEHGADPNMTDGGGNTAIDKMSNLNMFKEVIWMIEHGADVHKGNNSVAFNVQDTGGLTEEATSAQRKLKAMLMARGVKFPFEFEFYTRYEDIAAQWHQTSEGRAWQQRLDRLANDPDVVGDDWTKPFDESIEVMRAWMEKEGIPEPPEPPRERE